MSTDDVHSTRRTVLKTVGGTAVGLPLVAGAATADHEHPDVTTYPATDETQSSALLNGDLTEFGRGAGSVDVWFQWGPYLVDGFTGSTSRQTLSSPDFFSHFLTGLASDTTYKFRAVAEDNDDGDRDYGATKTFQTLSDDQHIR